jgi:trimeric autotransporter adhesin
VSATGDGTLTYQWKKNGVTITGATASTLTINNVSAADSGNYTVDITGCNTVSSNVALLTVNSTPTITNQPVAQVVCAGTNASFAVTTSGGVFTYQWRKGGVNISGATANSYSITGVSAGDAGSYDVVVTGCSVNVTSSAVNLTVNAATNISTQPSSQTTCAGMNASFTVAANGTNLSYQWRKAGVNITGATSATFTITGTTSTDAGLYDVVVTGSCGTVTSSAAALSVNALTVIATQPVSQAVCNGTAASFSVTATGSGTLNYQWRKAGVNITGATSSSLNFAAVSATDAASYDVVVTGNCGSVTSSPVSLTVNSAPAITTQPANQSACTGSTANFTVVATGSNLTYQWRKAGVNISGATNATFTINAVAATDTANYDVIISGSCGGPDTSASAHLSLNNTTTITTQPTAQTVCALSTATLTVSATGTGVLTYQWRKNAVVIAGATTATYSIVNTAVSDGGTYDVIITGTCGSVTSTAVVLTVNACTSVPNINADVTSAMLMPNVAHSNTRLHIVSRRAMRTDWTITDAKGNVVMQFTRSVTAGVNDITIQLENLAAGMYQLTGHTSKGRVTTLRFIKQ